VSAGVLDLWEAGASASPAARALLLLRAAGHDAAGWPVAARDRALLTAYCPAPLQAVVQCPSCAELLDVAIDTQALPDPPQSPAWVTVQHGSHVVRARSPSAGDLAALPADAPPDGLVSRLIRSCVRSAEHDGGAVDAETLPDEVLEAVDDALAAASEDGELALRLACASCGTLWDEDLDPVRFAWAWVEERAQAVAADVHTLASAYGWSESEILELSPVRRRLYLSAVWP
jgi:hypothetical protein